jgi:hypothetical protein
MSPVGVGSVEIAPAAVAYALEGSCLAYEREV